MKEKFQLEVTARITKDGSFNETLSVCQRITVSAKDFLELCEILGKFNKLAESLDKK